MTNARTIADRFRYYYLEADICGRSSLPCDYIEASGDESPRMAGARLRRLRFTRSA